MSSALIHRRRCLLVLPTAALALACDSHQADCPPPAPGTLTAKDEKLRSNAGYEHMSAAESKWCEKCSYYVATEACGTCELVPGPMNPSGTCRLFREMD